MWFLYKKKSYCEDPPIIPTLTITANGAPSDLYKNLQMRSYEDIRMSSYSYGKLFTIFQNVNSYKLPYDCVGYLHFFEFQFIFSLIPYSQIAALHHVFKLNWNFKLGIEFEFKKALCA